MLPGLVARACRWRSARRCRLIGRKNRWRISRIVTLPDYQGIGIGMRVAEAVAELHRAEGHRVNVTASHPALIAHCRRSPRWRAVGVRKTGSAQDGAVHPQLPRFGRPRGGVVRVCRGGSSESIGVRNGSTVTVDWSPIRDSMMAQPRRRSRAETRRPPVLDDAKRREILAILAVGCSRRAAAQYVGCAPRTIRARRPARPGLRRATPARRTAGGAELPREHPRRGEEAAILAGRGLGARTPQPERLRRAQARRDRPSSRSRQVLGRFAQIVVEEVPAARQRQRILAAARGDLLDDRFARRREHEETDAA